MCLFKNDIIKTLMDTPRENPNFTTPDEERQPQGGEKRLPRREFLGALGSALLSKEAWAQNVSQKTETRKPLENADLREKLSRFGAEFTEDYSRAELESVMSILRDAEQQMGGLKPFALRFEKVPANPYSKREDPGNPLNGYGTMGECEMDKPAHTIRLAPKTVLDSYADWEVKTGKQPKGEQGRKHDFQWTAAHEITHAISYRLGFGHELRAGLIGPKNPSATYSEFKNLSEEIRKRAKPLGYSKDTGWENARPEGYPTHKSYFAGTGAGVEGEIFADTGAYILTRAHYANNDQSFLQRQKQVQNIFRQIREKTLQPVNEEEYIDARFNPDKK